MDIDERMEELREELRHWPYTMHQIDETLDIGLIEGRGKQLLYQSINAQRLTIYMGSGASIAYGRLTWFEWRDRLIGGVQQTTEVLLEVCDAAIVYQEQLLLLLDNSRQDKPRAFLDIFKFQSGSDAIEMDRILIRKVFAALRARRTAILLARGEVLKLKQTFDLTTKDYAKFPGGEALPIQLQIVEQLHEMVRKYSDLFFSDTDINVAHTDPSSNDTPTSIARHFTLRIGPGQDVPVNALKYLHKVFLPVWANRDFPQNASKRSKTRNLHALYSEMLEKYRKAAIRPESRLSFEDLNKALLVDECVHAESIILRGVAPPDKGKSLQQQETDESRCHKVQSRLNLLDTSFLRQELHSLHDRPDRYDVLKPFEFRNVTNLIQELKAQEDPVWATFLSDLQGDIADYLENSLADSRGDRKYLTPSSRFVLEMLLCLKDYPDSLWEGELPEVVVKLFGGEPPTEINSRRSLIAERFDTVPKLVQNFKAQRFLTVNYDLEIERYFQDTGFRLRKGQELGTEFVSYLQEADEINEGIRINGIGAMMRDNTFERASVSNLVSFATNADGAECAVYHLHGRTTPESKIVVTERNYMDLYLREDSDRDTVDEAISLTFSSNPILFVGIGMSEADILRPLRQFISNRDRKAGYNAMVLLPAEKSYDERAQTSAALYLRYGVHTIFYGSGEVEVEHSSGKAFVSIDWLHRILSLIDGLKDIVSAQLYKGSSYRSFQSRRKYLEKKVGSIGPDLEQIDSKIDFQIPKDTSALAIIMGLLSVPKNEGDFSTKKISTCFFTSSRKAGRVGAKGVRGRHSIERLDASVYTKFYVERLTGLMQITMIGKSSSDIADRKTLLAILAGLNGLRGALITSSLNAALDAIHSEYKAWWFDWQQSPPHRIARFEEIPLSPQLDEWSKSSAAEHEIVIPRRYIRHHVVNAITDLSHAENTIIKSDDILDIYDQDLRTGVRSFDGFIDAVAKGVDRSVQDDGRRFYTVAARRGLGKGSFMSAFSTPLGITRFIRAGWHRHKETPVYLGAIFANLSFSTEIASVYDMIERAILECNAIKSEIYRTEISKNGGLTSIGPSFEIQKIMTSKFGSPIRNAINSIDSRFRDLPRLARLRALVESFGERPFRGKSPITRPRILICINAVGLLFTQDKQPKNSEIEELLKFLVGGAASDLPIDIVAIGAEDKIGWPWPLAKKESFKEEEIFNCRIDRPDLPEEASSSLQLRAERIGISFDQPPPNLTLSRINQVHFARVVNPTTFLADSFRPLAACLMVKALYDRLDTNASRYDVGTINNPEEMRKEIAKLGIRNYTTEFSKRISTRWSENSIPYVAELRKMTLDYEFEVTKEIGKYLTPLPVPKDSDAGSSAVEVNLLRLKLAEEIETLLNESDVVERSCFEVRGELGSETISATRKKLSEKLSEELSKLEEHKRLVLRKFSLLMILRYRVDTLADLAEWRAIRRTIGASRFGLTVLLAAAQCIAIQEATVLKGANEAEAFLRHIVDTLRSASVSRREELILSAAMAVYERFHVHDRPESNFIFQQRILRHLAAVGAPVGADVICRMPEMREAFAEMGDAFELSRQRSTIQALEALCSRGLVFRLSPHPGQVDIEMEQHSIPDTLKKAEAAIPADRQYRYTLHRSVQRYVLSKFGTMSADPTEMNNFAPSLYASMPSGLARLNHGAYQFLSDLMLNLSQYPDIPLHKQRNSTGAFPYASFQAMDGAEPAQALRAALSMVRSSFSIAVVSRFEDYKNETHGRIMKRGYFEEYRVRLRWILRKSWEMLDMNEYRAEAGEDGRRYLPGYPWRTRLNALYRDEIVWLYNEVGLTCLVQGNLIDAVAHLRQAVELNRHIEGKDESGWQQNRISINLALTQIERGRLHSACQRLKLVLASEEKRMGRLYYLANGYLGLADHIMGNSERAESQLRASLTYLRAREDFRACAVFGNHLARLVAVNDPADALRLLREARHDAESGGHEDIRRHIMISEVRISLLVGASDSAESRETAISETMSKLEAILDYSKMMSIHSLEFDALLTRARILTTQNENATAGQLLVRAMAIAKSNGLNLRLNSALTAYALVLYKRGKQKQASRLLQQSLDMAKRNRHRTEVINIQSQLDATNRES